MYFPWEQKSEISSPLSSQEDLNECEKNMRKTIAKLTEAGKVMVKVLGSKNVCAVLEFIFSQPNDLFENISGISFELDGLAQVVGNISIVENLRKKTVVGLTIKLHTIRFPLNKELNADLIQGFDDLEKKLAKANIWRCNFVILQIDLGFESDFEARITPYDNSDYFGIFASTTQAWGMVPIIQLRYDIPEYIEGESENLFIETMFKINKSLFNFEVQNDKLLISQLMSYPLKKANYYIKDIAESMVNGLRQSLAPAFGGVVFFADGSTKALAHQMDAILKLVERTPWPITSGYHWRFPEVLLSGYRNEVLEKWFKKQENILEMLSLAGKGDLIKWKSKPTGLSLDFIKTHNYSGDLFFDKYIVKNENE